MKKNRLPIIILIFIYSIFSQPIQAQITITIPKIPKIKKEKPQPKTEPTPESSNDDGQTSNDRTDNNRTDENESATTNNKCTGNGWLDAHTDDINKRREEVDSYTPDRGWFTGSSTYDHLLFAVSPSAKADWLKNSNALDIQDCPKLVEAFDKLAASAAKKLPTYLPNTKAYSFHNPAEEKLMKGKINNLADHKIFYIGVEEPSWLIEKNEFGIPKSRYKHGLVWVRYVPNDHPYCRIYYINIIQDYAGGGTYGASYGYFVKDQLAGCPAGK